MHLAWSNDLLKWQQIHELDDGYKAEVCVLPDGGHLLAYEKDGEDGCYIQLRYYRNIALLQVGLHSTEKAI